MHPPLSIFLLLLPMACGPSGGEGQSAEECADGVDNDQDGRVDCDDLGCSGYAVCEGGDTSGGDDTGDPFPVLADDPELLLNEFMASNASAWEDGDVPGTFPDWIELFNLTSGDLTLGGYTITDDFGDPTKAELPAGLVLPAAGWLVLVADSDPEEGIRHLPFKLARSGEVLAVYRPDGTALDALRYTEQATDVSLARSPDGGATWIPDETSTPGTSNAAR
ncbi:MAG: lamin tail domain-containing protein [Deltaproteobacteria bacterium]|nr:lamin tail domain-containing protein [Deltaproteobacteria bacterium]